ncbi:MAG: LPS export ABC transporter periplasmic protein LptC [Acidobacteria bacterium]|nr:LPS export ABC transporter periplasmic protein LptC [Acidobacteriota bacterium]
MRRNLLKLGRIIPLLVVVSVVGAVCISYYRSARTPGTRPVPQVESLPEGATDLIEGFSVSHSEQGKTTIEVTAKVQLGLQDSKSLLEQVKAKVFRRQEGQFDTITSLRCEVDQVSKDVVFLENVVVTLDTPDEGGAESIPAIVRAERMTYSRSRDRVTSEAAVSFERGRVSGSSQGLVYHPRSGVIVLPSQVDLTVLPSQEQDHLLRIRADRLKFHKPSGRVALRSNVRVEKGPTELAADEMRIFFSTPAWTLSRIQARGRVRSRSLDPNVMIEVRADRLRYLFGAGPGGLDKVVARGNAVARPLTARSLRELSAREITVSLPPRSRSIRQLSAVGDARVQFQSPSPSRAGSRTGTGQSSRPSDGITRRILTSPRVHAHFRPGTGLLSRVEALGFSTLEEIPGGPGEEKRRLSARAMNLFYGENSEQLERFTADRKVKLELASPSGTIRETRSRHLVALFDGQTDRLSEIRQTGDFNYREPGRQAWSDSATHRVDSSLIRLEGRPKVTDAQGETEADVIEFHRDRHLLKARGGVRSAYFGTGAGPGAQPAIFASAQFMEYRTREGIGRYRRNARLWQKDRILYAQDIRLNRLEGKLVASGGVTNLFHRPGEAESSPGTMVRSERMTYEEATRTIVYENGVATTTPDGRLQSDRLQVFLRQEKGQTSVDKALAEGNVRMAQPNRTAFSQWAEYRGREGKVVLWGGPPQVVDYERGSTTGARLTIDIGGGSVAVEGNSRNRAVTTQRLSR